MGTWKIEIHGHGIHHNKRADDANEMTAEFVKALRRDEHQVSAVSFTLTNGDGSPAGAADDLMPVTDVGPLDSSEHIMQFFAFGHLPPHLQKASKPFRDIARHIVDTTPRNPERTVALRKLMEAKDAAVRALLAK